MESKKETSAVIPIPDRMRHLKVDARGYPVPWGVVVDGDGIPHFAANDESKRMTMLRRDLCSICGGKLFRGRGFVGGTLSALHPRGAFIDPPMHSECAHFALQVCPYLAAPRYSKEIGPAKIANANVPDYALFIDTTMIPGRPHSDLFIAVMATRQEVHENWNCKPLRPYSAVEYWRHGQRVPDDEGEATAALAITEFEAAQ